MNLQFVCTYWGQEQLDAEIFFQRVLNEQYAGIEINFPESTEFIPRFLNKLEEVRKTRENFSFIAQQVLPPLSESVNDYIKRMSDRLKRLAALAPDFINSHTGKDYFSFDDNCRSIETVLSISKQSGKRW